MKKVVLTVCFVLAACSLAFAQESSDYHSQHGFFEPTVGINLFGTAYNPATENWGWHVGAKVLVFHPTRHVWLGGIGFGIAFDQSKSRNRGPVPVLTLIPLEIGNFSLEASFNRVGSRNDYGDLVRSRLIILAWNWQFH